MKQHLFLATISGIFSTVKLAKNSLNYIFLDWNSQFPDSSSFYSCEHSAILYVNLVLFVGSFSPPLEQLFSLFFFLLVILFKGFLWCLEKSYWLLDHFSHSFRCFLVPRWKHHSCCSGIHYRLLSLDYQSPKQKGLNPGTPFPSVEA